MGGLRIFSILRGKRGQALIEFAFILPLLLVIVGGIVDFALAFFVGQVIENAAREGARAGAVVRPAIFTPPTYPTDEEGTCPFPCGSGPTILQFASTKIPDVNLFSGFNLESTFVPSPEGQPNQDAVRVTVQGSYGWFILQLLGFEPITISRTAEMRWEWQQTS